MTTLTTLASVAGHDPAWGYHHAWFPFFPFIGFFFLLFVFVVVFGVFGRRRMWHARYHGAVHSAESDLARRFAAGEIDEKEYEMRVATLRRLRE